MYKSSIQLYWKYLLHSQSINAPKAILRKTSAHSAPTADSDASWEHTSGDALLVFELFNRITYGRRDSAGNVCASISLFGWPRRFSKVNAS